MAPNSKSSAANRPVACLRCRRNRSFCSKEKPSCLTCRKGNYECVYQEGKKISVLASYVSDLEARVKRYEDLLESIQPQESGENLQTTISNTSVYSEQEADVFYNSAPHEELDIQMHPLTEGLDNLVISATGKPQYLGSSSSTILGRRLRDVIGISAECDGDLGIDKEIATYNLDALHLRRPAYEERAKLPPYAVAKRYFAAQYTMIGTIFAFVSPDVFEGQLQQAYGGAPDIDDQEACLTYCQVFLIMAFGQMYAVNQYTDSDGPPGFAFFTQALQYLPDIHEEPTVSFCGVLGLIGYFMQNLNRRDAAFLYLGLAQRMAISLALHEEISFAGIDDLTKELRRRTWWSIYSLDRILCVKYGNPVTMHDEDISVALPSRLPGEDEYCPAVVLCHYTMLSKILSQIMDRIYRKTSKTGSGLMAAVQQIMTSLTKWEREIPDNLRFDPAQLTTSREAVSTFLHYYQCITMTARPLLLHIVAKRLQGDAALRAADWKQGLSQTTISIVNSCIFAARESISMMAFAAERDLVAVFGYMDGEHIFSSALVLVMVCVAFPNDIANITAMNTALGILGNMAAKGNHHIEARRQLLLQLLTVTGQSNTQFMSELEPSTVNPADLHADVTANVSSASSFPIMDEDLLDQMLSTSPETADLNMFEAAYLGTNLNLEFDLGTWTQNNS